MEAREIDLFGWVELLPTPSSGSQISDPQGTFGFLTVPLSQASAPSSLEPCWAKSRSRVAKAPFNSVTSCAKLAAVELGPGPARWAWNLPPLTSSASRSVSPRLLEPEQEAGNSSPAGHRRHSGQTARQQRQLEALRIHKPSWPCLTARGVSILSYHVSGSFNSHTRLASVLRWFRFGLIAGGATEISAPGV